MQKSEFDGARELFADFIFNRNVNLHEQILTDAKDKAAKIGQLNTY